jgi:hypothetical protein
MVRFFTARGALCEGDQQQGSPGGDVVSDQVADADINDARLGITTRLRICDELRN